MPGQHNSICMMFKIMADRHRGPIRPRTQNVDPELAIEDDRSQWPHFLQQMQQQNQLMLQICNKCMDVLNNKSFCKVSRVVIYEISFE